MDPAQPSVPGQFPEQVHLGADERPVGIGRGQGVPVGEPAAVAVRLAAEIGIDRSVASRHASRLEKAGLLRREPDPDDRRATLLVLTQAGEQLIAAMRRRLAEAVGGYLATWPPDDAAAFARSLHLFTEQGPWSAAG